MGFFNQFNSDMVLRPEVCDISEWDFAPLKDYIGGVIEVDGYFFTNGKYGKQVVVVGNGAKINMPGYAVKKFEKIDANEEAVDRILAGQLVIKDIEEMETKNGTTTGFTLADRSELEDGEEVTEN